MPDAASTPRRRLPWWVPAGLLAIIAGLVVGTVLQTISVRHHDAVQGRRQAAVDAASSEVAAFLSASASADDATLLGGATSTYRPRLQQQASAFRRSLGIGASGPKADVLAAGLVTMRAHSARVAVAATATARGTSSSVAVRNYWLTVTLARVGARWLVSDLRFTV